VRKHQELNSLRTEGLGARGVEEREEEAHPPVVSTGTPRSEHLRRRGAGARPAWRGRTRSVAPVMLAAPEAQESSRASWLLLSSSSGEAGARGKARLDAFSVFSPGRPSGER